MPTQVRGVYADIHTWENLHTAYLRAAHGKRSQEAVARFERRLEQAGEYQIGRRPARQRRNARAGAGPAADDERRGSLDHESDKGAKREGGCRVDLLGGEFVGRHVQDVPWTR